MADLEREAALRCEPCDATVYHLYRRRLKQASGDSLVAYEHVLWPANPQIAPPVDSSRLVCPGCASPLKRVAA